MAAVSLALTYIGALGFGDLWMLSPVVFRSWFFRITFQAGSIGCPFCRAGGMRGVMVPVLAWCMDVVQPAMGLQVAGSAWRLGCLKLGACVCSLGRCGLVVYLYPTFPFLLWAYSSGLPCRW